MLTFLIHFTKIDLFLSKNSRLQEGIQCLTPSVLICFFILFTTRHTFAQTPLTEAYTDSLSQKGRLLRSNKKLDAALETYQKVFLLRQELYGYQSIPVANALTNIGHCFYDKMLWDSAQTYYLKALLIEENAPNLPPEQPFQIGDTHRCLADCFLQKGDFLKAQMHITQSLTGLKNENNEKLAAAWNTQGLCFSYLGDLDAAIDAFKQAIQILPQQSINTWVFYTNLGDACVKKRDEKAIVFLQKAFSLMPLSAASIEKAQLLNKLGDYYFNKNQLDKALNYYQNALNNTDIKHKDLWLTNTTNLAKTERQKGNIEDALKKLEACLNASNQNTNYPLETLIALTEYAKTLFDKAFKTSKSEDWEKTLLAYERAIQFGEQYEAQFNQAKSALILRGYFYERYGGAAEACAHLGQYEKALFYSEQSKAYLLKQKNKTHFNNLIKDIRAGFNPSQNVLLEYCFGRQNLLLFIITSDDFKVKVLDTKGIQDSVLSLYNAVSTPFYSSQQRYFADASVFLYQQLIQSAQLPKSVPLIIVPDGILHYLPFDILLKEKPEKIHLWQSYQSLYLLSEHPISYKIAALLTVSSKEKADKELLGFAPVFEQHPKNLQSLKFNKTEVESLEKTWNNQLLIGLEATKNAFIRLSPQYRILHLSTHGIANDIYPDNSFLAFSFKDKDDNGILSVEEISNLDLKAELVTLSACQTASGTFYGGEGLMSIAHAFLSAGSHSILASLWDVNESITKDLMTLFYKNIKQGIAKDEALRQAKLNLILYAKDPMTAHPYFWSAFTIVGDTKPIEKSFNYILWLSMLCILLFGYLYLAKFQDKFTSKSFGRGIAKLLRRKPV